MLNSLTSNKDEGLIPISSANGKNWKDIFNHLSSNRYLVRQFVIIAVIGDLKRSVLGLLWLFILPVLAVIIWLILHGAGIIDPGDTKIPYPAYVLLSTSIWGFFLGIYKSTSNLIMQNGKIMTMTSFPHEVLIVSKIIVHFIHFSVPLLINIFVLYFFGIKLSWYALLFPLSIIPLLLLGLSIGLIIALFRVIAMDISKFVDQGMQFLMFLTPIVYAPKVEIGWLSGIITYNPLTYLIGFSRGLLTEGGFYETKLYLICSLFSIVLFGLTLRFFLKTEPKVIEKLINN